MSFTLSCSNCCSLVLYLRTYPPPASTPGYARYTYRYSHQGRAAGTHSIRRHILATLTPQEISRIVELAELNTCIELWGTLPAEAASQLGLRLEKVGSATALIMSKVDIGEFNRVFGLGVAEPATETVIDRIIALYAPAGNSFVVHVDPAAQPAELPSWLEQRGFTPGPQLGLALSRPRQATRHNHGSANRMYRP